jgi:TolA-binding protein
MSRTFGLPTQKVLFLSLGVLELVVALVLLAFACQLAGPADVREGVGRVERVSDRASQQVKRLQGQMGVLHKRRPDLQRMARELQKQMTLVSDDLERQRLDPATVQTVSNALGDVAKGLDGLSDTLDPRGIGQVGAGLKATADDLEGKVAPGASDAADRLEKTTADLRADALRLSALLKEAPLDLSAARSMAESLGNFEEGLGALAPTRLSAAA